ncbi:MAG: acetate--CoA ligase family protein [Melioribacteraceae bacterium]|nr:acetate--CoA ligase family protein [Melioribacteraceae bacterium]
MNSLSNFFYPKSICIPGASTKEKSIGYELLKTIKVYGYKGKVFPVNPKAEDILGYKCYHAIEEINDAIDLAIVVVPKQFAEPTVESLLKKNVKSIILITAGFKEIGKEGEALEKRILSKIKTAGARMVGPNCMGVINTLDEIKLNATFVAERPEIGAIGFLSQSGALGAAVLNSLRETDIKFAHFISVGNKADINENDVLNFWQNDNNIKTITCYLESFVNGEEFVVPFIRGEISKPTIVLKAGKTESGMKAASSHTGALSSNDKIIDALLKQFGIIRAEDLNELFNTAKGFESFPLPKGKRIAVITNAGGPAILCIDKIEKDGLKLATFSDETMKKLKEIVHPEGSVANPVDLLPGGNPEIYKRVNEIVINDESVDAVISIFVEPVMVPPFEVIESVYSIDSKKPILQVAMPLPEFWSKYRNESLKKLPLFRNPEDPAEILSNMYFYMKQKKKLQENRAQYVEAIEKKESNNNGLPAGFLSHEQLYKICSEYKLPIVKQNLIKPEELKNYEAENYPLVIKGINKNVVHKSELDAVKLNIKSKEEFLLKAREIEDSFAKNNLFVDEFLIQPFITIKHELLIGGFRDPSFGPVIMFGSGGKYVEVFDDTSIRSCYLCDTDIDEMIDETKIGKILKGVRGETPVNIKALKEIIKSCTTMMAENQNIAEFDLNPLILGVDNIFYAVDVRIKIY